MNQTRSLNFGAKTLSCYLLFIFINKLQERDLAPKFKKCDSYDDSINKKPLERTNCIFFCPHFHPEVQGFLGTDLEIAQFNFCFSHPQKFCEFRGNFGNFLGISWKLAKAVPYPRISGRGRGSPWYGDFLSSLIHT